MNASLVLDGILGLPVYLLVLKLGLWSGCKGKNAVFCVDAWQFMCETR